VALLAAADTIRCAPRTESAHPSGTGTESVETLGELMLFDKNMSPGRNEACTSCHMPYAGLGRADPVGEPDDDRLSRNGSLSGRQADRAATHIFTIFPSTPFNAEQMLFFGGNFWDSRATGYLLRNPDAEQAQGPPVDTQKWATLTLPASRSSFSRLCTDLSSKSYGAKTRSISSSHMTLRKSAQPRRAAVFGGDPEPIKLRPEERTQANTVYDRWGQSIDAYEQSVQVSAFTSKFDAMLHGDYTFTADEMAGYNLFKGKGNCNSCHVAGEGPLLTQVRLTRAQPRRRTLLCSPAFGSANEGLPVNPRNAFSIRRRRIPSGSSLILLDSGYRDLGMGTFLRSGFGSGPNPNRTWIAQAPSVDGQFQVATARNAAMAPPQCPTTEAPGPYFQKEFFTTATSRA